MTTSAYARDDAPTHRVVGYSTGTRPTSSRSTFIPISCTSGKMPDPAHEDDTFAARSLRCTLGRVISGGRVLMSSCTANRLGDAFQRE